MSLVDRYRSWFEYEVEAHGKTLAAIDSVPATHRDEPYQSALDLFAHLMACRQLWLSRIGEVEAGPATLAEIFPSGTERRQLDERLQAMAAAWRPYLERLGHAELGRNVSYVAIEGEHFSNSVEEVLTQLFGHAWHHRGQIMSLVRACGGEPEACDFVYWTRRRTPDPEER